MEALVEGMKKALEQEFQQDIYAVYTEQEAQGFSKPCFYLTPISDSQERKLGNQYREVCTFMLTFFPEGATPNKQMRQIGTRLFDCLETIKNGAGMLTGEGMRWEVREDTLQFFIQYQRDLIKPRTAEAYMEEVTIIGKTRANEKAREGN